MKTDHYHTDDLFQQSLVPTSLGHGSKKVGVSTQTFFCGGKAIMMAVWTQETTMYISSNFRGPILNVQRANMCEDIFVKADYLAKFAKMCSV